MTNILFNYLGVCFVVKRINQLFLAQGEYSGGRDTLQSRSMLPMPLFLCLCSGSQSSEVGKCTLSRRVYAWQSCFWRSENTYGWGS